MITCELLKKYKGIPATETARILGVSVATISNKRRECGLAEPLGNPPLPKTITDRIIKLRKDGLSIEKISLELGISVWSVRKYLRQEGFTLPMEGRRIPLPEKTINKIKKLREEGYSGGEIAGKLKISTSVIYKYSNDKAPSGKYSPEKIKALLVKHKFNAAAVGREMGTSRARISQIIRAAGLWEWFTEEREKFKNELPKIVLEMHEKGISINEISERTGKPIPAVVDMIQMYKSKRIKRIKEKGEKKIKKPVKK